MKIQYASDLHLEFADNWRYLKENPLQVTGDILVLAGDIGYLGDDNYTKHPFWDWASENYQQVIACMGNHEFYKFYDIAKLNDGYCLEIRPNVHNILLCWAVPPIHIDFHPKELIILFRYSTLFYSSIYNKYSRNRNAYQ